jgi:hypothetical protein
MNQQAESNNKPFDPYLTFQNSPVLDNKLKIKEEKPWREAEYLHALKRMKELLKNPIQIL